MRGDLFDGWAILSGDFPPSCATDEDSTSLKAFESPAVYGVSSQNDGRLATASCPSGTARSAPTKSVGGYTWIWAYNRCWRFSGATLYWMPPYLDSVNLPHGVGRLTVDANIITILPVFGDSLLIVTATGSYVLNNANREDERMVVNQFVQDFYTTNATYATVLMEIPYVCNAVGVFSFDGRGVKEWTRPIRDTIGSFASVAILADYDKKLIIGTSKFALDVETNKLFDYGTAGFRFTSRTMAQAPRYNPYRVDAIALSIERSTSAAGTISWQSKSEDGTWYSEPDIVLSSTTLQKTRIEVNITNPIKAVHKFAMRLTALPAHIYVRNILLNVQGLAEESFAE